MGGWRRKGRGGGEEGGGWKGEVCLTFLVRMEHALFDGRFHGLVEYPSTQKQ